MAEVVENQEKTFEHYLELPEKVRMFVIDEQQPDDRVRFTRCSKICNQEAKASKNYIYGLSFTTSIRNHARIEVKYGENHGYNLHIQTLRSGGKGMFQHGLDYQVIWGVALYSSMSVFEFAIEDFKKKLHIYQDKIKKLQISDFGSQERWDNINFGIENLNSLEDLEICAPIDIQQFLSKIRHPLKTLSVSGDSNIPLSRNYEQIVQVRDLTWTQVELDSEQLQRLPASFIEIGIGKLTERDIFKFIRSWQDGSIGKEILRYAWHYSPSTFNWRTLLRLLRLPEEEEEGIEIKHFIETGKSATLDVYDCCLFFYTYV